MERAGATIGMSKVILILMASERAATAVVAGQRLQVQSEAEELLRRNPSVRLSVAQVSELMREQIKAAETAAQRLPHSDTSGWEAEYVHQRTGR